ncbi:hypothetical protein PFISCL1PPCAC_8854, partial [Pristionchus fissidentatus]
GVGVEEEEIDCPEPEVDEDNEADVNRNYSGVCFGCHGDVNDDEHNRTCFDYRDWRKYELERRLKLEREGDVHELQMKRARIERRLKKKQQEKEAATNIDASKTKPDEK